MAAFALTVTVPLKGPCFTAAGLSGGQNPPPNSRLRHRRGSAIRTVAWSMGSGARGTELKAQVAKWVLQNDDYLYDARALHIDTRFSLSASYIDLLNRTRYRDPELGRTRLELTEQSKRHQEAREKRSRELVDGLMEYISSDNENYKYIIIASKENANMIMEEGFISSYDRDEILDGLERIEKDIEEGKFQWKNNKDIRTNIIEALIDIVEGPAKRLDAVISHYDQMLRVLGLWCNDSIDKFVTQIKELQFYLCSYSIFAKLRCIVLSESLALKFCMCSNISVWSNLFHPVINDSNLGHSSEKSLNYVHTVVELVLLAIRNKGLVVRCINGSAQCILLGDMVLLKVEQLENDVSRLVSCKNKMDSTRLALFPSGSTDGSMNSLSYGGLHHVHNSIMDFGNLIVGDIAHDLTDLEHDLNIQLTCSLTRNDEVTKSFHLMLRHKFDLDILQFFRHSGSIYNAAADSSKRFLKAYKGVPEIIKAAREFVRNSSFDPEKFLTLPPGFIGDPKLAGFRASKDLEKLYGREAGAAAVKRDFKSHSDAMTWKLLDWLRRLHQLEQQS